MASRLLVRMGLLHSKVFLKKDAIVGLKRFSKPGLRQYRGYNDMPRVLSGTAVVSTSKGVISSSGMPAN